MNAWMNSEEDLTVVNDDREGGEQSVAIANLLSRDA